MATAPSPNDLTRQQLDELDALLQRMLNLPLTAVDPPPPAPAAGPPTVANWRADPPAPAPAPAPHLAPVELPRPPARVPRVTVTAVADVPTAVVIARTEAPPEPAVPVLAAPPPAPVVVATPPEPRALAPADEPPIITPTPLPNRVAGRARPAARVPDAPRPPAPAAPAPVSSSSTPHPAPRAPHSPLLWPLVAVDRVADIVLGLMGPPGWLLRTGFGKNLLGLAGLGLMAYTGAHLAVERGLLALPFPLPWPG